MRILNKMISTIATTAIATTLLINIQASPSQADIVSENECLPAVLMLRGSGELRIGDKNPYDNTKTLNYKTYKKDLTSPTYIKTNGYEGAKLSQLLQEFVSQTDPSKTVSKVRFIGIDYPAEAIPFMGEAPNPTGPIDVYNHLMAYNNSYNQGGHDVLEVIENDTARGCNTQYMLVGYSQGVISARIASSLMDNNTDKIISSYVIGDPYQNLFKELNEKQKSPANTGYQYNGVATDTSNTALSNPVTLLHLRSSFALPLSAVTALC